MIQKKKTELGENCLNEIRNQMKVPDNQKKIKKSRFYYL